MNTPTFDEIFEQYYTLYRAESEVPNSADDEYTIAMRLANEALSRWANYDATYWNVLYSTNLDDLTGDRTVITGTVDYDCPTNMRVPGGLVQIKDATGGVVRRYPVIEPGEVQFQGNDATYAYFTKSLTGWVLHLNPEPDTAINGLFIDYPYYKMHTEYTTGTSRSEIPNPYFVVHRMLGNRFRASRNPYYASAMSDAEEALKIMQLENNAGTAANPWKVADKSGTTWGEKR